MHESCPAWGGSTSVGTTPSPAPSEKSRRRAIGVSSTTWLGSDQPGLRRRVVADHQRAPSCATLAGVAPRRAAARQYSASPFRPADQAAIPSSSSAAPAGLTRKWYVMVRHLAIRAGRVH